MAVYYVGPGGNNANDGLSWANRKLTLGGAEAVVAAGDTVYVGVGVYRETLTVATSGSAGNPIVYVGDYTGAATDGVGGVVRITGSDNDQTATRNNAITATSRAYRTFRGFVMDTCASNPIALTSSDNTIIEQCHITGHANVAVITVSGADTNALTVRRCVIMPLFAGAQASGVFIQHTVQIDDRNCVIENCIIGPGRGSGVVAARVGGVTVRNCMIYGFAGTGAQVSVALTAGQVMTVNNCLLVGNVTSLGATTADEFVENYNTLYATSSARNNVNTGANSNTYPPLFDTRWFFEAVNGGKMVTPFDLASYSQLVNVAGASPTTADMRGTTVIGAQREWGPLEYDPALLIEAGSGGGGAVSISPWRGNIG
jgi:hypothetical protein